MTCIISSLTDDYVMQVSDRRLTIPGHRFSRPLKFEHANKALFLSERYVFGYTGIAEIRGRRAELVLAELWANISDEIRKGAERFQLCADSLTADFKRINYTPALKRHAYLGVGWAATRTGELAPAYIAVSNFYSDDGTLPNAKKAFELRAHLKTSRQHCYVAHGGTGIPKNLWWPFVRHVRRAISHNCSPKFVSCLLLELISLVAANDPSVAKVYGHLYLAMQYSEQLVLRTGCLS